MDMEFSDTPMDTIDPKMYRGLLHTANTTPRNPTLAEYSYGFGTQLVQTKADKSATILIKDAADMPKHTCQGQGHMNPDHVYESAHFTAVRAPREMWRPPVYYDMDATESRELEEMAGKQCSHEKA